MKYLTIYEMDEILWEVPKIVIVDFGHQDDLSRRICVLQECGTPVVESSQSSTKVFEVRKPHDLGSPYSTFLKSDLRQTSLTIYKAINVGTL